MPARITPESDWVIKILALRKRLGLNQSEFAGRLDYSAMALSRWESGTHEPTSRAYLQMGNLAQGKESTWFWTRAGMNSADLARRFPEPHSLTESSVSLVDDHLKRNAPS